MSSPKAISMQKLHRLFSPRRSSIRRSVTTWKPAPVSARMVERVARYVQGGSWLDVGVGNGSLLFTAEEWGHVPAGLDLRKDSVHALKQLGYEAHCLPIEKLDTASASMSSAWPMCSNICRFRKRTCRRYGLLRQGGVLSCRCQTWRTWFGGCCTPMRQSYWGRLSIITIFPQTALCSFARSMGFSRRISHQRTLPRMHGVIAVKQG